MSTRLGSLALVAALLVTSACTSSRAAIVSGAGSMLFGGMLYADGSSSDTRCTGAMGQCDGFDTHLGNPIRRGVHEAERTIGVGFLLTGAALVVLGLVLNDREDDAPVQPAWHPSTAPSIATTAPVSTSAPGIETAFAPAPAVTRLASPAEIVLRARVENRLAIQASSAAGRGDCIAAAATSTRLAEIDPVLHAELVRTDAHLAGCLERAGAQN
ncbi:MAG: hypothetical protein JWP01_3330 [Myxococcales bacterium]|nr:hypothetical protein [Myxococcales bacterium]